MSGLWLLSWRHVTHNRARTSIVVLCIAVAVFLPATLGLLVERYQRDLVARAATTPMVAGAVGNRFDLVLAALYFRQRELDTIPFTELRSLAADGLATAIPVHVRFTARRHPVVGTSPEYYELRGLRPEQGTLPLRLGDVLLGSGVAQQLDLAPGGALFSDPTDLYDISRPPALKMRVCGVLPETGKPDDDAVFVDIKTCWILEGLAHGHDAAENVEESNVLGRADTVVNLSPAVTGHLEVTDANVDSFHFHGDEEQLPLSAILVVPRDLKAGTLLKARVNTSRVWQIVVPRAVVDDLLRYVFQIKALFDAFAVVLAVTTALLLGLQILLSMRLRSREMATLNRIGCSPHTVAALYGTEIALLVLLGVSLAGLGVLVAQAVVPDLVSLL